MCNFRTFIKLFARKPAKILQSWCKIVYLSRFKTETMSQENYNDEDLAHIIVLRESNAILRAKLDLALEENRKCAEITEQTLRDLSRMEYDVSSTLTKCGINIPRLVSDMDTTRQRVHQLDSQLIAAKRAFSESTLRSDIDVLWTKLRYMQEVTDPATFWSKELKLHRRVLILKGWCYVLSILVLISWLSVYATKY